MSQRTHYNTSFEKRELPIVLIADGVSIAANVGSLFRIADAFGISKLLFCNADIDFSSKRMTRTARATIDHIDHELIDTPENEIMKLKEDGYHIISLEITHTSTPLSSFNTLSSKKIALIIGSENFGVSESLISLSDTVLHIDMYGNNSSMNVSQAAGIALYELSKQLLITT